MINLAQRDIAHSFGKFITTSIGVGLLIGVVLIMIGVFRGMSHDALIVPNDIGADLWVVQKDTLGPFAESSKLHEDAKYSLKSIDGVDAVYPLTFQSIQIEKNLKSIRVYLMGYESSKNFRPFRLHKGKAITNKNDEIIVDIKTNFDIGETLQIANETYKIVGLTKNAVSSGGDPMIYLDLDEAQKLQFLFSDEQIRNDRFRGIFGNQTSNVNTFAIKINKNFDDSQIASQIKRWKHFEVFSKAEQEEILTKNLIERSAKQIGLFTIILLIVSSVIISLIIYTMTINKIKEIAILKLIGAPNITIVKMILEQSLLLGIIAFVAGVIFAHLSANIFPKTVILQFKDASILFCVIIFVSTIASISGIKSALKVDPATAIGG